MLNVDVAGIDLGNTANKLQRLQQTQFIENRVQEEDVGVVGANQVPEIQEKPLMGDVEATKIVMQDCIQMLNNCYEKVSLDEGEDSDVEDEAIR